jgi:prepilin-type N-terminal cleavage/methylation domain-containing protein
VIDSRAFPRIGSDARGLTLIELIVVIGITGLLAAVAIPNYRSFQYRAMNTQAKLSLSSLYLAETSFKGDWGSYSGRLDAIGFDLVGKVYFDVGFKSDFVSPFGPRGTANCNAICGSAACPANPARKCMESALTGLDGNVWPTVSIASQSAFYAEAHGHLGLKVSEWYSWTINEQKILRRLIPAN